MPAAPTTPPAPPVPPVPSVPPAPGQHAVAASRRTALQRALPYLLIGLASALVALLMCRLPAQRVGDGSEYYAMFYAWSEAWRPWTTAASHAAYDVLQHGGTIEGLVARDWFDTYFSALRIGVTTDFNHFWFYSLLAVLCQKLLLPLGVQLSPHASFMLLHAVLLATTFGVAWRHYRWRGVAVIGILIFGSPIVWYLNKVHTEVFTVCLLVLAMLYLHRARYAAAALLLALVSTQNPSFALIAGIPWVYRVVLQWRHRYSRAELLMLAGAAAGVLLHPAYYLWRYRVPTPQLLAGGADLGGNLSTFYIWIIDPDLGLLPNWPLGTAALLLGATLWLRRRPATAVGAPDRYRTLQQRGFVLLYLAINFYAQSSTTNLNSGATPGLARYALWYLPLALPLLLWIAARCPWRSKRGYAVGLLALLLTLASVVRYDPRKPEQYGAPSTLSYQLQYRLPDLYDPPPEVFMERYSGVGEGRSFDLVVGPDCRKVLLQGWVPTPGAAAPRKCLFDLDRLSAYRRALGNLTTHYVTLSDAQAAAMQRRVTTETYLVGSSGHGSFALGNGWSQPEPWGTWSDSKRAELYFPCAGRTFDVVLQLAPFNRQHLTLTAGGATLWQGALPTESTALRIAIAPAQCTRGVALVTADISHPTRPSELGPSNDRRRLGVALTSFRIVEPGH